MWMSDVQIIVDRNNVDANGLRDIAAAITDAGAVSMEIDEDNHVLTVTVPANAIATIKAMEGVRYVRPVLTYYCAA